MNGIELAVVEHSALTSADVAGLSDLFDREYVNDFGEWNPELPYGYASHGVHVIARTSSSIVGHMGWGRRLISVGGTEMCIGGVGGILVSPEVRGQQLGQHLMAALMTSLRADGHVDFGFLGCDESVVPFYASCGWRRISAWERSTDRQGRLRNYPPGAPLMIYSVNATEWPEGLIDLRGRAW